MNSLKFSVIIPLYNKADTIKRAIDSVLSQTCPDFELIVVDDGSKDNGTEVVSAICDARIRLVRQANGGVSKARNRGIELAQAKHVTFLDADDEYLPDFLATLEHLIAKYPDAEIYGTGYYFETLDGKRNLPKINGLPEGFEGIVENYFEIATKSSPLLWTGAVCVKNSAIRQFGGFPVGVTSGEDLMTWAKLCAMGQFAYSHKSCAVYYLGETCGYLPTRIPQANDIVGHEMIRLYRNTGMQDLKKYIALWYKNRISCFLRLGMKKQSFRETCIALRYAPSNRKLYLYLLLCFLPGYLIRKIFMLYWSLGEKK